ncbi:MAG: UvrABC system protein B [bacterium]|nr:UvrABC system protein B [bacterium]
MATALLQQRVMQPFELASEFAPSPAQLEAINAIAGHLEAGQRFQTLLGVTGSGKTYVMANIIAQVQRPTLIIAHNKTLAAQLAAEFREFFPNNRVEYFVSYYDYYQPEAYVPSKDLFIEKDSAINEEVDRLRHAATQALLTRRDVIIVASVSCIYGLGSPADYTMISVTLRKGESTNRTKLFRSLIDMQFLRNDVAQARGTFRVKGDTLEIFPVDEEVVIRVEMFGDEVESLAKLDRITGEVLGVYEEYTIFPASHYVILPERQELVIHAIEQELEQRLPEFVRENRLIEHQRLKERTHYDIEMLREMGFCNGIENYSRHFAGRPPGEPPSTLVEYFPDDFLMFVDESHQTIPQIRAMAVGDLQRKQTLVDYGFRLPSAIDNRPLRFEEWERLLNQVVFVSATPAAYEMEKSESITELLIRPTGLVDPEIEIRPVSTQVDDLLGEIRATIEAGHRILVTTLTKKMSEDLSAYLKSLNIRVRYLHSEIETLDRIRILRDLRLGEFDVLVGINLLREGLDLPEVALVAILDADKAGFLRSETSLIQTMGRAARHETGRVILYADTMTPAITVAVEETRRRRERQLLYNTEHGIVPTGVKKGIRDITGDLGGDKESLPSTIMYRGLELKREEVPLIIEELRKDMFQYATDMKFEKAAEVRDEITRLEDLALGRAPSGDGTGDMRRGRPINKKVERRRQKHKQW